MRESTGTPGCRSLAGLGISIFTVGHVTKEGGWLGPRCWKHMVDTSFYLRGDRHVAYRGPARCEENRRKPTNEIGVFEMRGRWSDRGGEASEFMLSGKPEGASGSVVACSMEGTRPILLENTGIGLPQQFRYAEADGGRNRF